jgi:hypothetical protein
MTRKILVSIAALVMCAGRLPARTGKYVVGWASVSVTPDQPVPLAGQMNTRISKSVHDPVTATALAIEAVGDGGVIDQAVLVSVDFAGRPGIVEALRERLRPTLRDLDLSKVIVNGTHTHTAPETEEGIYRVPKQGVMQIPEYRQFLLARLADVVTRAWQARKPAGVSWGLGHAVVGHNRRAVYFDGHAQMYGATNKPDFSHIEGYEDHAVQALFFWTPQKALTGIAVLVPCPSQEVEGESYISADFWADVRARLRTRYSSDLFVLPLTGASGDQSPHLLFRKRAEDRQRERRGLSRTQEIARRIDIAVAEAAEGAGRDIHFAGPLAHTAGPLPLPLWKITDSEADAARRELDRLMQLPEDDRTAQFHIYQQKEVLERFARQREDPYYRAETHVIRLGDVAIATNPFELYLDYAIRIEARSPAEQTLIVQLACGYGGYLPTRRAAEGGGYGAKLSGSSVGPDGGQTLVERTVEWINALWQERP